MQERPFDGGGGGRAPDEDPEKKSQFYDRISACKVATYLAVCFTTKSHTVIVDVEQHISGKVWEYILVMFFETLPS